MDERSPAERVREELDKIDQVQAELYRRPWDSRSITLLQQLNQRRSELLGLNRPQHTKVVLIIPSRGRPDAALQAAGEALFYAELPNTQVLISVDGPHETDQHHAYLEIAQVLGDNVTVISDPTHRGLVGTLNRRATQTARTQLMKDHRCKLAGRCQRVTHIGFIGDDHRMRTPGWDARLAEAAGEWGIAYGNDLLRGAELPTSVVMSADLIRVLGKMAPSELWHMYCDDYWLALGRQLGRITYLDDVIVEHLHPAAGKAQLDDSYRETNSPEVFSRDATAWAVYCTQTGQLAQDVAAINREIVREPYGGTL